MRTIPGATGSVRGTSNRRGITRRRFPRRLRTPGESLSMATARTLLSMTLPTTRLTDEIALGDRRSRLRWLYAYALIAPLDLRLATAIAMSSLRAYRVFSIRLRWSCVLRAVALGQAGRKGST
jgi:hypothetical protein